MMRSSSFFFNYFQTFKHFLVLLHRFDTRINQLFSNIQTFPSLVASFRSNQPTVLLSIKQSKTQSQTQTQPKTQQVNPNNHKHNQTNTITTKDAIKSQLQLNLHLYNNHVQQQSYVKPMYTSQSAPTIPHNPQTQTIQTLIQPPLKTKSNQSNPVQLPTGWTILHCHNSLRA